MITVPYNALIADKSHYSQRGIEFLHVNTLVLVLPTTIFFIFFHAFYISCSNLLNSSFILETSFRKFRRDIRRGIQLIVLTKVKNYGS